MACENVRLIVHPLSWFHHPFEIMKKKKMKKKEMFHINKLTSLSFVTQCPLIDQGLSFQIVKSSVDP